MQQADVQLFNNTVDGLITSTSLKKSCGDFLFFFFCSGNIQNDTDLMRSRVPTNGSL